MQFEPCFYWLGGGAMHAEDKTKLGPFISNRGRETLEAANWCLSFYSNIENGLQYVILFHLLMSLSCLKWATDIELKGSFHLLSEMSCRFSGGLH